MWKQRNNHDNLECVKKNTTTLGAGIKIYTNSKNDYKGARLTSKCLINKEEAQCGPSFWVASLRVLEIYMQNY